MKTIKQYKYWIIIIAVLMVIATFFDYQISVVSSKLNENFIIHSFYRFFEIFGEFAAVTVLVLMFGLFFNFGLRRQKSVLKYIQVLLNGLGFFMFSVLQFLSFARYLFPEGGNSHGTITTPMFVVCVFLGTCFAFLVNNRMKYIDEKDYKYFKKVALVGLLYVVLLTVAVNAIKFAWARPRYWMVESGEAPFVPWYILNGADQTSVTNAYMSFVSGHTANAFVAIYLSLWSLKNREKYFNYGMIWGLCVAVSRIFAGQHYLSDTLMGGTLSFVLFMVLVGIFKLNNDSKENGIVNSPKELEEDVVLV